MDAYIPIKEPCHLKKRKKIRQCGPKVLGRVADVEDHERIMVSL